VGEGMLAEQGVIGPALSNGQTRIAKAVMKAPELLSLDEPLSECSSFLHSFFLSISRNFPHSPTFIPSFLVFAAFSLSLSRILASRSPLPASSLPYFFLPYFLPLALFQCLPSNIVPFSSLRPSFTLSLAYLHSFQQILTISLYLAGVDPTSRPYLLALPRLEELHTSQFLRIILGMHVQSGRSGVETFCRLLGRRRNKVRTAMLCGG